MPPRRKAALDKSNAQQQQQQQELQQAVVPAPAPGPENEFAAIDKTTATAPVSFVTTPGHRFHDNFQDLFQGITEKVIPSFCEFEGELNAELSSLAGLTGKLCVARARSEAKLKIERRRLVDLKNVLAEIAADNDDEEEELENDPFNDADTVAGRSSSIFSDPDMKTSL